MIQYGSKMAAAEVIGEHSTVDNFENLPKPERVLLFSGKRKSGKDYITDILHARIGVDRSIIIKISAPIKTHWAKALNLDVKELMSDKPYKEKYRLQLSKWGEDVRKKDYGYFCRAAVDMYAAHSKPIWIVSDIRRKTDIKWFTENYKDACKTIRIVCSDSVRQKRDWSFTEGIDDAETECDLDDVKDWDLEVENNDENIEPILQQILHLLN